MADIQIGEILYFTPENGGIYSGKVVGTGNGFLSLKLFTPDRNLKNFESETSVSLHLMRVNDAEYLIRTKTAGVDDDLLKISFSDDLSKEREFRHPYVNVVIPAIVTILSPLGIIEPEQIEGTVLKLNEYECVIRISSPLEYGKEYPVAFEISKYKFNISSRIVSSKTVETESVYYLTFKFLTMTDPGKAILTRYISESI